MAYRRTDRVEARLADNRQRILHATRRILAEEGFRLAQIGAIAASAGVATGTIYRYFPSKADLFAEVLRVICRRELDVVTEIAASGGSASDRLATAVRAFASRALQARRLAYAIIVEPVDPGVDEVRLEFRRAQGQAFEGIIADGVASGELPPQDARASSACLVGAFLEGLAGPLAPESAGPGETGPMLVDAIVTFALRAVGAHPRTGRDGPPRP